MATEGSLSKSSIWELGEERKTRWSGESRCPYGSLQPQATQAARLRGEVQVEGPVGLTTD